MPRRICYVGDMPYFRSKSSMDCRASWKSLDSLVL